MPIAHSPAGRESADDTAEVFLSVKAKRAGPIKGEAQATGFAGQIDVRGWHWGVKASSAIDDKMPTSRRSYTALSVVKGIDAATTPLMSALATNDEVTEAVLTMRRAGGDQEVFFVVKLKSARVSGIEHEVGSDGLTQETVAFVFAKVEVEYTLQQTTGRRGGTMTFTDELAPS